MTAHQQWWLGVQSPPSINPCVAAAILVSNWDDDYVTLKALANIPTPTVGDTIGVYRTLFPYASDFVSGDTWSVPATVAWADAVDNKVNVVLDKRIGGTTYDLRFHLTFTGVPSNEDTCKTFVCITDGNTGPPSPPGVIDVTNIPGPTGGLQLIGTMTGNYMKAGAVLIRNNHGTLSATFL